MTTYRIAVFGANGVGKTSFLQRFLTGEFTDKGPSSFNLTLETNYGPYTLNLNENTDEKMDGAVIMFDVHDLRSYSTAELLLVQCIMSSLPNVVVGNKVDKRGRVVRAKSIDLHRKYATEYYDISAKSLYNHEKPFLSLLRKLSGHSDLTFVHT